MSMKGHGIAVAVIMKNGEVIEEEFSFDNEEWVRLSCKPGLFQNMDTMEEFHDNFFSAFEPGFDGYDDDEYTFAELMEDVGDIDSFEDMMQTLEGYTPDDIVQIILLTDFEDDGYRTYDWQKFSMKPYCVTNGTAKADMAENSGWSVKYSPTVHEFIRAEFIKPQKAVARKKTIRTHDEEPAKTFEKKGNQVMMHAAKNGYAVVNNDWAIKLPDNWVWTTDPDVIQERFFWGLDSTQFYEYGPTFQYTENCFVVIRVLYKEIFPSLDAAVEMLTDGDVEKFITKSGITIVFNCKMDFPSTIFIETRTALYMAGYTGGYNEHGIYWSRAKKLEEMRKLLNTIHYVGEEPTMGSFSGEDLTAFAKATEALNDVTEQLAQGQEGVEKYSNYLEQKEAREKAAEEEKAKKKAAAIAAGKNEDDIVNMYIILTNEKKIGKLRRSQEDFYKTYEDDFLTLSKMDVIKARKNVLEEMELAEMEDESLCEYYAEKFKQRLVKDRFDISTKNLKAVAQMPDTDFGAEWAIENTREWYEESELPEVRRLMDANLAKGKKDLDEQLDTVESAWKKYSTGKKFLKITVSDKNADGVEIREDCSGFQVVIGSALVEVQLSTKGVFRMATPVMNCFPWYWGVSAKDIWEAALKNEVSDDRKGAYDGKQLADKALAQIKSKYSDKKATVKVASQVKPVQEPAVVSDFEIEGTCLKKYTGTKKHVNIPDGVTEIGKEAFDGYANLASITIPEGVIKIGEAAFCECGNLTRVVIPESVTDIDEGAFSACSSLKSITLPKKIKKIGKCAFSACSSLTRITIPDGVAEIDEAAFGGCMSLTTITIPPSVIEIGESAFSACMSLEKITIPESVVKIGEAAFGGCMSLATITIPPSVTKIGAEAFNFCNSNLTICGAVGSYAEKFAKSKGYGFKTTTFRKKEKPVQTEETDSVSGSAAPAEFEIEGTCLKKYNGTEKHVIIPEGVTEIGENAFKNVSRKVKKITVPEGVVKICPWGFYKCEGVQEIILPESLIEIGGSAFNRCKSLRTIRIPKSIKSIPPWAFDECIVLEKVDLHDGIISIGQSAFHHCTSLLEVSIPQSVEHIGQSAFYGCTKLKKVVIPAKVSLIGGETFWDNDSLAELIFEEGIKEIILEKDGDYYRPIFGTWSHELFKPVISLPKSLEKIEPEKEFLYSKSRIKKLIVYKGTYGEEFAKRNGFNYELILTEEQRREEEERKVREEEERRRKAEEDRLRLEEERRRFEEARKVREEEERKRREAEERRRQEILEAARKEYDQLKEDINLQMQIIKENKGWFGAAAKARKAAQVRLEALQARMAKDFPTGRP